MASKTERRRAAAIRRRERLLRDRDALKALRQHFTGYEARDGYSLSINKIAAMQSSQRRAIRKKYTKLAHLLSTPHDIVTPRSPQDAKVLRRATHQRLKGQKHFIVHVPDPKRSKARVVKGQLEIVTKLPGRAEVEERIFYLPGRPKSPDDLLEMLNEMLETMPQTGEYVMQTDTYGDTGAIADYGGLRRQLQSYLASYDKEKYGAHRFLNRVIGWRWIRSKLAGRIVRQKKSEAARDRLRKLHQQKRDEYRQQAQLDLKPTVCPHGIVLGRKCRRCPKGVAKR